MASSVRQKTRGSCARSTCTAENAAWITQVAAWITQGCSLDGTRYQLDHTGSHPGWHRAAAGSWRLRTAAAAASSAATPPAPRAAPPGIGTERDTVRPAAAPSGTCIVRAPAKRHRTSSARGVRRWRVRSCRSRRCRSGPSTRNTICSCCRLSHPLNESSTHRLCGGPLGVTGSGSTPAVAAAASRAAVAAPTAATSRGRDRVARSPAVRALSACSRASA